MIPLEDEEESWPNEPDEFDPASLGPDPPDVTGSTGASGDETASVSNDLARAFWASVLFVNIALFALSIGAMLIYFQGNHEAGIPALVIGLVAAISFARYYRDVKAGRYTDDDAEETTEDGDTGGDATSTGERGP